MPAYYTPTHWSQYAAGQSASTRRYGCTWTSLANGIATITGGRYRPEPDDIHDLLPPSQETNPLTPGWSIPDAVKAAGRYGVQLQDRTGDGWAAVIEALNSGHYVVLQGDSDQFGSATCSGDFDGDHCIGINPSTREVDGHREWFVNDPICPGGRWERESVLRRYAEKLYAAIRFAVFTQRVPRYEWRWTGTPPLFIEYTVDPQAQTWSRRKATKTKGTRTYHVSPPETFHHAPPEGVDLVGDRRLVRLGELVNGGKGEYTGRWVAASHAERTLTT